MKPAQAGGVVKGPDYGNYLRLFTVSEEIAAGRPIPSGIDPNSIAFVEIEQVLVNQIPYRVKSLTGARLVNVLPRRPHMAVRVSGSSMNAAGIDNGDYVLLRVQQTCGPNDIVAIELVGVDTAATLKRWKVRNGQVELTPESFDKRHQPIILGRDVRWYVHGVVVAVLKPV